MRKLARHQHLQVESKESIVSWRNGCCRQRVSRRTDRAHEMRCLFQDGSQSYKEGLDATRECQCGPEIFWCAQAAVPPPNLQARQMLQRCHHLCAAELRPRRNASQGHILDDPSSFTRWWLWNRALALALIGACGRTVCRINIYLETLLDGIQSVL